MWVPKGQICKYRRKLSSEAHSTIYNVPNVVPYIIIVPIGLY